MNFHKNDESVCTTKINKEGVYKMNIFESLGQLLIGAEERWLRRLMDFKMKQSNHFYRRFSGKHKSFKKNKRRGF